MGAALASAASFFFDYNTLESVLLGCGILVNLAGIMFESNVLTQPGFRAQRDFVAVATLLVIALSVLYFGVVFVSEVVMTFRKPQAKATKGVYACWRALCAVLSRLVWSCVIRPAGFVCM